MTRHFSVKRFWGRLFLFRRAINDSLTITITVTIMITITITIIINTDN